MKLLRQNMCVSSLLPDNVKLFSRVVLSVYTVTNKVFIPCSTFLPIIISYYLTLNFSQSGKCVMVYCGYNFMSLVTNESKHFYLFMDHCYF